MSIEPIAPLTVDPIAPVDPEWFDGEEDIAEKIARDIEYRAAELSRARRNTRRAMTLIDYEVDEIVNAAFRVSASIARRFATPLANTRTVTTTALAQSAVRKTRKVSGGAR